MKKFLTFTMLFLFPMLIKAHALWIETAPQGKIGQEHLVKIYFGELAYGMYEEVGGDSFNKMKNFKLYLIDSDGNKSQLSVTLRSDHYIATFTPEQDDLYTLSLENDDIPIINFTKYDFGIFKTHYHASVTVAVGNVMGNSISLNSTGLSIFPQPSHNGTRIFQATYKEKPIVKAEVSSPCRKAGRRL